MRLSSPTRERWRFLDFALFGPDLEFASLESDGFMGGNVPSVAS